MRVLSWCCVVMLLSGLTFLGNNAYAEDDKDKDEETVALDKLPKEVIDAVKKKFPKAELVSAAKEKDDDEILFEVTIRDGKQMIDVMLKPSGAITEFEKELAAKDLPKDATEALEKKYPKATIKKVEAVYEIEDDEDELEFYEVLIVTADKKEVELKIEDGKIEEDEKDDDKDKKGEKEDKDDKEDKEGKDKKDD